jgi:hypothetical protein
VTFCDSPKVFLENIQYNLPRICRSLEYYVDPDSENSIELGTKQFPYRAFKSISSEILNQFSYSDVNITIYLKEGTKVYVQDDTTFFMSMTFVTMTSYSDNSDTPDRALIIPTAIEQQGISKKALLHILKHTDLWLEDAISKGKK